MKGNKTSGPLKSEREFSEHIILISALKTGNAHSACKHTFKKQFRLLKLLDAPNSFASKDGYLIGTGLL